MLDKEFSGVEKLDLKGLMIPVCPSFLWYCTQGQYRRDYLQEFKCHCCVYGQWCSVPTGVGMTCVSEILT